MGMYCGRRPLRGRALFKKRPAAVPVSLGSAFLSGCPEELGTGFRSSPRRCHDAGSFILLCVVFTAFLVSAG